MKTLKYTLENYIESKLNLRKLDLRFCFMVVISIHLKSIDSCLHPLDNVIKYNL